MLKRKLQIFTVACILFVLFSVTAAIRYSAGKNLGGDQVHYLVMTGSLLQDGDFDLRNDYDLKRYYAYYPGPDLDLHIPRQFTAESPTLYSLHNPGIPIFIAPFLHIFGYNRGGILAMLIFSLSTIVLTYLWCLRVTQRVAASVFASAILFISVAYLSLVGYIFPNLITASLTLGALLLLENKERKLINYFLLGMILAVGPWIHVKVLLSFALIGFVALITIFRAKVATKQKYKEVAVLCAAPVILLTLFEIKLYAWYGVWLPSQTFAGGQLFLLSPFKALLATFFDSTKGFFTNNPGLLLIFLGIPLWIKKAPKQFLLLTFLLLPSYLLQLTFSDWWGGWSPTGRYLMEMLPVVMPAVAYSFLLLKNIVLGLCAGLLITLQLIISCVYLYLMSPWVWVGERNPVFEKISQSIGMNIDDYLPHFSMYLQTRPHDLPYTLFFVCLVLLLLVVGFSQRSIVHTRDSA